MKDSLKRSLFEAHRQYTKDKKLLTDLLERRGLHDVEEMIESIMDEIETRLDEEERQREEA